MPRPKVMKQMLAGENLAMCIGRQGQVVGDDEWNLVFCSQTIEDFNLFYRGGNLNLPLYHYTTNTTGEGSNLFSIQGSTERQANLSPKLVSSLTEAHEDSIVPEEVFFYIYAILHVPCYRLKYCDFLSENYPRIPITVDRKLFTDLASSGERLVALHLLNSSELDSPVCHFDGNGDQIIAKTQAQGFRYDHERQRMYINGTQYFAPITTAVYEYRIGGYQVCEKWLKDRKERRLDLDDIRTYCQMVTALDKTLEIQQGLDDAYNDVEENCVTFENS